MAVSLFLSHCYGGRASDRHAVRESRFLDKVSPGDTILADRGFPIAEDLLLCHAKLVIPPPGSGIQQMTKANVRQRKQLQMPEYMLNRLSTESSGLLF